MKELSALAQRSIKLIRSIPKGKVLTYSAVSNLIGASGCARHVSYILSSSSAKYDLPWYRVLSSTGKISLSVGQGYFKQVKYLKVEGVELINDKVELDKYLWKPSKSEIKKILKGIPKHIPLIAR